MRLSEAEEEALDEALWGGRIYDDVPEVVLAIRADAYAAGLTARDAEHQRAWAKVRELRDEWLADRDTCLAWIADPEMHVDPDHPQRLSKIADVLNQHAERLTAALPADPQGGAA